MILHIETATKVCSVALSNEGKLIAEKSSNTEHYSHAENLNVFIQDILDEAKISFKDLSAICVTSGPGSYTGLRVGVSTAKALCYTLEIPLISVDSLFSIATQLKSKYPGKKISAMIDARRMEVFSAIYDENLDVIKPISADIIEESSYEEYGEFVAAGDGVNKLKEIFKHRKQITLDDTVLSSAIGQIELAHEKYLRKDFEDVAYFEPFYLKDFK